MERRLIQIDGLTRGDHSFLNASDMCYYVMEYTAGKGYSHSPENQIISNLKKKQDRKNFADYRYKGIAIRQLSRDLREILPPEFLRDATIVPMPPSQCKTDALYDDRLMQVLTGMTSGHQIDIREIIFLEETIPSSHESAVRPRPEELKRHFKINQALCTPAPTKIIIFDDMITAGAHFRAASDILSDLFPGVKILGVFISRRAVPPEEQTGLFTIIRT